MTIELEAPQSLPCSPQELTQHVLPMLGVQTCQSLLEQIAAAPQEMMTLCFLPTPTYGGLNTKVGRTVEWEFQQVMSMTEFELKLLARRLPMIERLYASRKVWKAAIVNHLSRIN